MVHFHWPIPNLLFSPAHTGDVGGGGGCCGSKGGVGGGGRLGDQRRPQGILLVISGPSGVGKTTITHEVEKRLNAVFSVSATTRPKTPADTPGVDYDFVDVPTFERMIRDGGLLEHARVFDHYYGTPRHPVEQALIAGRIMILEIDVQGALQVRRSRPDALMIFVLPPTDEELLSRLRKRQRESEEKIQRRFREAKTEMETAKRSGKYDLFIVNEDVAKAVDTVCAAVRQRLAGNTTTP